MRSAIGNRITLSKKGNEYIIKVSGMLESWMNYALLGWTIMWSGLGIYMIYILNKYSLTGEQQIYYLTYLCFWAYFEVMAVRSYLFRSFGYELIKITPEEIYIKRSIFSYGKVRKYQRDNIKDLRKVETNRKSFSAAFNKSFWVLGNERIQFTYVGREIGFGMHLEDKERNELMVEVRRILKRK